MIHSLARRPGAVFLLLACYFALNVAVRLALPNSMELDESEQVFFSQWMALGYGPQAPLYNWVLNGFFSLFGVSIATLTLFKNGLLFLSYLFYGLTAQRLLRDNRLAVIAVLGLLTIPQISFEAQRDLTHTVAVIFAACFFLHMLVRTLQHPTALSYALTGAAIGIGMISKYNFALLPLAALVAVALDGQMRKRLLDWRLLLTAIVALAVVVPHGLWLIGHLQNATESTIGKLREDGTPQGLAQISEGLLSLVLAILGFTALTFVIFLGVFGNRMLPALRAGNAWTALIERMVSVCLGCIVLMILFAGSEHIKDRWLSPLLLVFPPYLCMKIEAAGVDAAKPLRRFVPIVLVIMAIVPAVLFGRIMLAGASGDYGKLNVPYEAFARAVIEQNDPSLIMVTDHRLGGNLFLHAQSIPVVADDIGDFRPQFDQSTDRPVLLVWRAERQDVTSVPPELAEAVRTRLGSDPAGLVPQAISLPYIYGKAADSYRFGYALVPPPAKS